MGATVASATGLSTAEVAERIARGETNAFESPTSRSAWSIIRANVFTLFNGIIAACFLVLLLIGRWQDALFGVSAVANTIIGSVQEFRAKRSLDKLALMHAPHARVLRDGGEQEIAIADVVLGDTPRAARGRPGRGGCLGGDVRTAAARRVHAHGRVRSGRQGPRRRRALGVDRDRRRRHRGRRQGRRGLVREQALERGQAVLARGIRVAQLHQPGARLGGVDHRADQPAGAERADGRRRADGPRRSRTARGRMPRSRRSRRSSR